MLITYLIDTYKGENMKDKEAYINNIKGVGRIELFNNGGRNNEAFHCKFKPDDENQLFELYDSKSATYIGVIYENEKEYNLVKPIAISIVNPPENNQIDFNILVDPLKNLREK